MDFDDAKKNKKKNEKKKNDAMQLVALCTKMTQPFGIFNTL